VQALVHGLFSGKAQLASFMLKPFLLKKLKETWRLQYLKKRNGVLGFSPEQQ
jgi:hypothetical protein